MHVRVKSGSIRAVCWELGRYEFHNRFPSCGFGFWRSDSRLNGLFHATTRILKLSKYPLLWVLPSKLRFHCSHSGLRLPPFTLSATCCSHAFFRSLKPIVETTLLTEQPSFLCSAILRPGFRVWNNLRCSSRVECTVSEAFVRLSSASTVRGHYPRLRMQRRPLHSSSHTRFPSGGFTVNLNQNVSLLSLYSARTARLCAVSRPL